MRRRSGHWTRSLFAGVALAVVAGVGAAFLGARDPVRSLQLDVGELRARAAELAALAQSRADGAAGATFARVLARQLVRQIDDTLASVRDGRDAAPALADRARSLGQATRDDAARLATEPDAASARAAAQRLDAVRHALVDVEHALGAVPGQRKR